MALAALKGRDDMSCNLLALKREAKQDRCWDLLINNKMKPHQAFMSISILHKVHNIQIYTNWFV